MGTEQGQNIASAMVAVRNMQSDCGRLLRDCDKFIGKGRPSVFGSFATKDLTYSVNSDCWMAEGLFRYYDSGNQQVDGISITLWRKGEVTEPLLIMGRIQYATPPDATKNHSVKDVCDGWDLWWLYFEESGSESLDKVLEFGAVDPGRVEWARVICFPLMSISNMQILQELMSRVIAASPTVGQIG